MVCGRAVRTDHLGAERRRDGIPLPDAIWTKISAVAAMVGIDATAALAG